MWVPSRILDLFNIAKDTVDSLRQDLAAIRAERDTLQRQLSSTQITCDWLRVQINTLQLERTGLIEKAYGIKLPAPEIVRASTVINEAKQDDFSFDDMGEKLAKQFGMQTYDH